MIQMLKVSIQKWVFLWKGMNILSFRGFLFILNFGQEQSCGHVSEHCGQSYPSSEHCGKATHRSSKCWQHFGKPLSYTVPQVMTTSMRPLPPAPTMAPLATSPMISLSWEEYDWLMHGNEATPAIRDPHHASNFESCTALISCWLNKKFKICI